MKYQQKKIRKHLEKHVFNISFFSLYFYIQICRESHHHILWFVHAIHTFCWLKTDDICI